MFKSQEHVIEKGKITKREPVHKSKVNVTVLPEDIMVVLLGVGKNPNMCNMKIALKVTLEDKMK